MPKREVTNDELVAYVGGTASWVYERTGIVARHYADASETTSMLAKMACERALKDANMDVNAIDAIIFATLSPDVAFPGCGVFLQQELGLTHIPALDVRNQCSGYLYGLSVADAWIRAGVYEHVLLVGAEIHSAGLDFSESGRSITVLFGDGAGAVVLSRGVLGDAGEILEVRLGADGSGAEHLWCEVPGTRHGKHITREDIRDGRHFPSMNGRTVFRRAIETLTRETKALLHAHDLHDKIHKLFFVPHQANRRINEHLAQALGIRPERVAHTIKQFGNTTAASIPMALDMARRQGEVFPGTIVLHAAFGSGFTWGSALIRF